KQAEQSSRRAPLQHAMMEGKKQPPDQPGGDQEETQASRTLLEQLVGVFQGLQKLPALVQVLIVLIVLVIVVGVILLFILAALVPGAYVGIAALLANVASFLGGRATKR